MPFSNENRIYIGNLARGCREKDVEKFVQGFGRVEDMMFKGTYAFIEFEDARDAEDAVDDLDGKKLLGERVIVERARGIPKEERWRSGGGGGGGGRYGGGGGGGGGGYGRGRSPPRRRPNSNRYGPTHRTKYRLTVENLSSRVSWQDLKDFMRQIGEVTYTDAHRERKNEGEVEFTSRSDLKKAIEKLDGTELQGRKIRLYDNTRTSRSRSRSGSRSPKRRRSRSPRKRRSRSRSKSRSKSKSRSGSRKKSRSKSSERRRHRSGSKSKSKSKSKSRSRSKSRDGDKKDSKDAAAISNGGPNAADDAAKNAGEEENTDEI